MNTKSAFYLPLHWLPTGAPFFYRARLYVKKSAGSARCLENGRDYAIDQHARVRVSRETLAYATNHYVKDGRLHTLSARA